MAGDPKSFEDMRDILGRLDRRISDAREARTGESDADEPASPVDTERRIGTGSDDAESRPSTPVNGIWSARTSTAGSPTPPARSPYGRAKPIRRDGDQSW